MNDRIFSDMTRQMKPGDEVRNQLFAHLETRVPPTAGPAANHRHRTAWFAAAACLVALASGTLLPGAIGHGRPFEVGDPPQAAPPAPAAPASSASVPEDSAETPATGYEALYTAVRTASEGWGYGRDGVSMTMEDSAAVRAPMAVPAAASTASGSYQTNAQVAGIDEGDIVKSDGRSVFIASGSEVVILAAEGAGTRELARIDTGTGPAADTSAVRGGYVGQGPVADLMLHDDTLVVLVTDYSVRDSALPASEVSTSVPLDAALTKALLYDVSDPAEPRYLTSLGQSGAFVTSRLQDGILYLVTEYLVADPDAMVPDDPETFVPVTTEGASRAAVPAPDCFPLPYADGPRYAVASSIDLASRERIDTEAVLGGSQTVYMSSQNLFLASTDYNATLSATQRKIAGADDLRIATAPVTHLARITLDSGRLSLGAEASIPGQVINQFALDEYEGHLRLATTVSGESRERSGTWVTRPALYVLDSELKVVGSLPELAKNESVESVRFDGPVGYIVSFERRDPLFAIDLTRPAEPKVMSALKIPGFSTYLDLWADGRLLGLGMDARDDGTVTGIKLSMFDTSDPFDVSELTTERIAFDDSEALSNHKAVLVDRERGLIGFPAVAWEGEDGMTARYLVYGYDQQKGFELRKKLPLEADDRYGTPVGVRGLRIEGFLYVASPQGVDVYSATSLDKVGSVGLE